MIVLLWLVLNKCQLTVCVGEYLIISRKKPKLSSCFLFLITYAVIHPLPRGRVGEGGAETIRLMKLKTVSCY